MSAELWLGAGLTLAAGMMSGNCMLPSKFVRQWSWENTWFIFTLVSLIAAPWLLTLSLVNNVGSVYAALSPGQFVAPFLFGFGWGIAQVLFGLSIARLGMALGYAIIVGLGALLGTLVPIVFQRIEVLGASKGALILTGVAVMVAGIVVSGAAGRLRELGAGQKQSSGGGYTAALATAVLCGVMAPMLNFSFAFGQDIAQEAVRQGTSAANASYAVWPIGLAGGLIPNLAYSIYLLNKNRSWSKFSNMLPDVWCAIAMGILWMGAVAVYGVAASFLGALGTSVGWALFQIFMIMTANVSGVVTGEWKGATGQSRKLLWAGLALLAVATVIMAYGNR